MSIRFLILFLPILLFADSFEPFVAFGVGENSLLWSIAGKDNQPNIQSELEWKDQKTTKSELGFLYQKGYFVLEAFGGFETTKSGSVRDSDYTDDDRQGEYKRSISSSKNSYFDSYGFRTGVVIASDQVRFVPLFVYRNIDAKYLIHSGFDVIPDKKPITGLNSSYEMDFALRGGGFRADIFEWITIRYEQSAGRYRAVADWNLRDDLDSFAHRGTIKSTLISIKLSKLISDKAAVFARFDDDKMELKSGTDTTYFADGTAAKQALKEVSLRNRSLLFGVEWRFR